jgi:hypothetical protein
MRAKQSTINEILQLVNAYAHAHEYRTTTEHLASEVGYLAGWLASITDSDWTVRKELDARLEKYKITEATSEIMNKRRYNGDK